jgi:two-component system cell cycle response regulator
MKGMSMNNKPSILIVDDDESTRRTLSLIFKKKGHKVESVGTGRAAIDKARGKFFNLALLDIKLPDMEGVELLAPLKEMHPDMVMIMVTAYASSETAIRALNDGASGYITKPLNMDEVLAIVREALEKQHLVFEKRQADEALKKTTRDLKKTVEELRKANLKILEQQKSVIEEERLKVLLQMSGATAHELNQPLTILLGNIELMKMRVDNPEKYIDTIEKAGQRMSDIIKKTLAIRHYETRQSPGQSSIIDLDQKMNILSVEDSDEDFEMIKGCFRDQEKIRLSKAHDIDETMRKVDQGQYDLILLDYILPDGNGLDFLKRMNDKGIEIPVIVITARGDQLIASQVIQEGAYDYLPKEMVSRESLSRSITNTTEKARLKREIHRAQEKLSEMSIRDELTGLYNHRYFKEVLEREVARAKRYKTDLVLCMMDLDHFKRINDQYGHPAGDRILSDIGRMLKESIRESDLLCRYGGEEFAIILPNTRAEDAQTVCERFRAMVAGYHFEYDSLPFQITVSVGIASYSSSTDQSPMELVKWADKGLYQAKEEGRNRVRQYQSD